MAQRTFQPGDPVVYRKEKCSTHPGRRAHHVIPASQGDDYRYQVDKFRVVVRQEPDGKVVLQTRRGRVHVVDPDDPRLRPANILDRLLYGRRFPRLDGEHQQQALDT